MLAKYAVKHFSCIRTQSFVETMLLTSTHITTHIKGASLQFVHTPLRHILFPFPFTEKCHLITALCFAFNLASLSSPPLLLCSDETYMIGFVVPNQKLLLALADQYGIRGSLEELCNSKAMEELVLKVITETAVAGEKGPKRR